MLRGETEHIDRQLVILAEAEVRDRGPGQAVHSEAVPGQGGASVPATSILYSDGMREEGDIELKEISTELSFFKDNVPSLPVEEGGCSSEPEHLGPCGLMGSVPVRVDKPRPELG